MLTREQEYSRQVAIGLRELGLNPFPSHMDEKRPWVPDEKDPSKDRYAHLWDVQAPAKLFTEDGWPATQNLQLVTGVRWRLIAFDLDGQPAIDEWARLCRANDVPETWMTLSGGGGRHIWFRLPEWWRDPLPKAEVWRPSWPGPRVKGESAIERLCDRSLVMYPPSIHPRTGIPYRFGYRRGGPKNAPPSMPLPADAPAWVLDLPPLRTPRVAPVAAVPPPALNPRQANEVPFMTAQQVLDAIPDKAGIVERWGLRFAGQARDSGWIPCRAIDREDRRPSAAFHRELGRYKDQGSGESLSMFDLAIRLGQAIDYDDAKARLMENIR